MSQDWLPLTGILSNLCVAGATVALVILGYLGLQNWKKELKGRQEFDLARRIALLAFEFQAKFDLARMGSIADAKADAETWEIVKKIKRDRYNELDEVVSRLEAAKWEASLIFKDGEGLFGGILSANIRFQLARREIFDFYEVVGQPIDTETFQKAASVLFGDANDEYGKSAHEAVKELVETLKAYIK